MTHNLCLASSHFKDKATVTGLQALVDPVSHGITGHLEQWRILKQFKMTFLVLCPYAYSVYVLPSVCLFSSFLHFCSGIPGHYWHSGLVTISTQENKRLVWMGWGTLPALSLPPLLSSVWLIGCWELFRSCIQFAWTDLCCWTDICFLSNLTNFLVEFEYALTLCKIPIS